MATTLPTAIAFNADAHNAREFAPCIMLIGGREVEFGNPRQLDWKDILALTKNSQLLRKVLSPEDFEHVAKTRIPADTMNAVFEVFFRHFDMDPNDPTANI